jgi:membrane-bound lytic murein transglycosylase D
MQRITRQLFSLFLTALGLLPLTLVAQPETDPQPTAAEQAAIAKEDAAVIHILDSTWQAFRLDMRYAQRKRTLADASPYGWPADTIPLYNDAVYQQRLKELCMVVPMDYNVHVRGQIDYFNTRRRQMFSEMLGMQHVYFPIFEEILDREGMPLELRYLPIIESAMNPAAKSRVAATGLWQFMHYTAKLYDIRMDSYIDERSDPYKATEAAAAYLKHLHSLYDDWLMAIAAYNCGPGRVNWAIRKAGKHNVWEIYKFLPRETRGYVPAFIATCYTMNYWREHNLRPVWVDFEYGPDSLVVQNHELHLDHLARVTGTPAQQLRDMNPALKLGVVPYNSRPYTVHVPHKVALFAEQFPDSVYRAQPVEPLPTASELASQSEQPAYSPPGRRLIYHPVRGGESLLSIATYYSVYINDIKGWNNLKTSTVSAGQKLKVFVRNSSGITQAPAESTAKLAKPTPSYPSAQAGTSASAYASYKVRSGDTLSSIASRYPGVSVNDIMKANQLASANKIQPGQVLKIPTR